MSEPASEELVESAEAEAPQIEAPLSAPAVNFEPPHEAEANALPAYKAPAADAQSPPVELSPAKASAISIAAALVRHDKREAAPPKPASEELPLNGGSATGDDLTAIGGIDDKLAKELNDLGIRHFDQIIEMSPDHADQIASLPNSAITSAQRAAWMAEAKALVENEAQAIRKQAERAG